MQETKEPHQSRPIKSIFSTDVILLTVLGLLLLLFSICRRNEAFPSASLDLKINKAEAIKLAQGYAETTGFTVPKNVISSTYFSSDTEASTFLEYEYPLSVANELMRQEIPIWHWKVHLLDGQGDQLLVFIGANGSLHSFEREISKGKEAPSISHDDAKKIATDRALKEMHIDLSDWSLIEDAVSKLPKRTDHAFAWENEKRDYKGGHLRLNAIVSGDKLSNFSYTLHVPDSFQQKFKYLRAQNLALAEVSLVLAALFAIWLPVTFLRRWTKGQLRIKFAIYCGLASAAVVLITNLNDAATIVAGTSNWTMDTFLAKHVLSGISTALLIGLVCTIFFGAIESVYRKNFPSQPALELFFTRTSKVFRALSVARGAIIGLAVFGITTGYQVAFFLVGKQYGLWFPLGIQERSIINDFFPAWHAISIGVQASTIEELGFRILMLSILQRITKSFWIANILQAAIWGFGHCTYAVEPPYARGIELGILGLFYGWILRRYGLLPLILGHYAFDSYLTIQTLFSTHNLSDWASGLVAVAPVFIVPIFSLILISKSGVVSDDEISNKELTENLIAHAKPESQQEQWPAYHPISQKQIRIAILCSVLAGIALVLPKDRLGEDPKLQINHQQAISIAREYFSKQGFRVDDALSVAWLSDDTDQEQLQYLAKHTTFDRAKKLERLIEPRLVWNVRLFRPATPNVFYLRIGPDGAPVTSTISLDEMVPGAKLDRTAATDLAKQYLHSLETPESGPYRIFDTSKLARANRTDYSFTAESPAGDVGDAHFQLSFKLIGNNPSDLKRTWAMPNTNARKKRDSVSAVDVAILLQRLSCALGVIPTLVYWIFSSWRRQVPNKLLVSSAVIAAGCIAFLSQSNYVSRFALCYYNPTEPLDTHLLTIAVSCLTRITMDISIAALLAAVVSSSYRGLFVSTRMEELLKSARPQIANYRIWSDAVLIGFTAAVVSAGIMSLNEYANTLATHSVLINKLNHIPSLEQTSVVMTTVLDSIKFGLLFMLVGAALQRCYEFYVNLGSKSSNKSMRIFYPALVPALIVMVIYTVAMNNDDAEKFFCNAIANLSMTLALYLVLTVVGNRNIFSCFFTGFFLTVGKDLFYVQKNASLIHPLDLALLYLLFLAPVVGALACLLLDRRQKKYGADTYSPEPLVEAGHVQQISPQTDLANEQQTPALALDSISMAPINEEAQFDKETSNEQNTAVDQI
jgi:Type II CAAX prenyl endopeptidase Rce1-like